MGEFHTVVARITHSKGNRGSPQAVPPLLRSKGEAFKLFAADLPQTPGADIAFEITTGGSAAMVSYPISQIDPTAWHELVAREVAALSAR
jgi:hypothetical protein